MIKKILIITLLFNFLAPLNAQKNNDFVAIIDKEQKRIDDIDGQVNGTIIDGSEQDQINLYNYVYFKLTDSIQKSIVKSKKLSNNEKKSLLYGLSMTLQDVTTRTYKMPLYFQKLLENASGMIGAYENGDLTSYLITDPLYSIKNVYFYKLSPEAKNFLIKSANTYPDEVLKAYDKYSNMDYKDTVIEVCGVIAPDVTKNYLIGETDIKTILAKNTNPSIMGMRGFFAKYNILSKGMVLVDDIIEGKITREEAHQISENKRQFLRKMIEIRNSNYVQATYSLDKQLETTSLEFVREINNLHNEQNPKIRFACIDNFNWKELYTTMVYSEEEIFTSTFNGIFKRLIFRLKEDKVPGDKMLQELNYNRFRTFIRMCANYGVLEQFMETMPSFKSREILSKFTNNLDKNEGDLQSSINVANAFSSITDTALLSFMRYNIDNEYARVQQEGSKGGTAIYGLLASLFDANGNQTSWTNQISNKYHLQPIDMIYTQNLYGHDGVHRQIHFFYDDEDGDASFSTFMSTFNNANYKTKAFPNYVEIKSTNGKVIIYANKPKSELEGQNDLIQIMTANNNDIQVMVHRGHSYYAMNTIEQIPPSTKIVFLGSCGSYHNIHEVIGRASNVHIISSKQIGTMTVNNPLLFIIAETVRNQKDMVWADVWKQTQTKVGTKGYAADRFRDYVSPDKNLGAIFLKAYTNLVSMYNL